MADLGTMDAERLQMLIAQPRALHRLQARSRRSSRSGTNIALFRKVMPVEYRRALTEMAKEKAAKMQAAE